MSMDVLQEKIRKLKNPSMVDLTLLPAQLPACVREAGDELTAYTVFCREMLTALKGTVPAVRFSYDHFALLGGLDRMAELLTQAGEYGYYVALDGPQTLNVATAQLAAEKLTALHFDGLIMSPYIGSDGVKPFMTLCKERGKDLFFAVRTANKSALELQDLLTGSRHVYAAAADVLNRFADGVLERSGYSRIGLLAACGASTALMELRRKYNRFFLLVDGLDTPGGNAKNASLAFDRLGHGAVVCAGTGITCAWQDNETDGGDYLEQALQAAQRMQKNLTRYLDIV